MFREFKTLPLGKARAFAGRWGEDCIELYHMAEAVTVYRLEDAPVATGQVYYADEIVPLSDGRLLLRAGNRTELTE